MFSLEEKLTLLEVEGTLSRWEDFIKEWAEGKGWNEDKTQGDWIALIHTEISEAFEAYRNNEEEFWYNDGKPDGMAIELADAVIRIMHWFSVHDCPLNTALIAKMRYNLSRPYKHGGKKI